MLAVYRAPLGGYPLTYTTRPGSLLGADFLTSNAAYVETARDVLADKWVISAKGWVRKEMLGSRGILQPLD